MIITDVMLEPFGFFTSKKLTFKEGLNVILGPNEAGKSTAFYAIQKALFTTSKLKKIEFKREIEQFLPIGGDTVQVEICFILNNNEYRLKRIWGGMSRSELHYPDGSLITDDIEITRALDEVIPATPGTFKSVLMTYQSGLIKTIEELKSEYPGTMQTLSDILRKAVLETDGVSIDKFREKIQTLYQQYYSHWDNQLLLPEKKRGIENPWKKEVGYILEHYYKKERTRTDLDKALNYEEELDTMNRQLAECTEKCSANELYIKENKRSVDDARIRKTLDAEMTAHKTTIETYTKDSSDWPVRESKIQDIDKKLQDFEKKEQVLINEKQNAETEEKNKSLREKFNKVKDKKMTLDEASDKLSSVQKITKEDLKEVETTMSKLITLETKISAGKLSLKINAKRDITVSIQKDVEEQQEHSLLPDKLFEMEAGGIFKLDHEDWHMELSSGEGDIDALLSQHQAAKTDIKTILQKHNVESLEKASEIHRIYDEKENAVNMARNALNSELGDDTYEELDKKINEIGEEKTTRSMVNIVQELEGVKNEIKNFQKEKNGHENVMEEYLKKYKDKQNLFLMLGEKMRLRKETQEKIDRLTPLPEGIVDVDKFTDQYEKKNDELEKDRKLLNDLRVQIATLQGKAPEVSSEELEKQLSEEEEIFQRIKKKGESIAKIKDLTEFLVQELDADTHLGLKKDLEYCISKITGNKYDKVALEEGLPKGFIRKDGKVVPYELLSTGTKDALSLSLRLSMANHFLKEANGFIIMDDPLVDLDPERQKRAAGLINEYSKEKQILIFTCHPAHAELLEGNLIEI